MMNVSDTDKINSTISYLRSNIYNNDIFKGEFINQLSSQIPIDSAKFVAEQYGGWSIYINIKNEFSEIIPSCVYNVIIEKAIVSLKKTIINIMKDTMLSESDINNNIFSIIMSGQLSFVIKI